MNTVKMNWKQYRRAVSIYMTNTYGVGLDELEDCDLEGRGIFHDDKHIVENTLEEWTRLFNADATTALQNDDLFGPLFRGGAMFD